jgi:signal transduction histidine kinase
MNTLVSPRRPVIAVTAWFLGLLPLALALATLLLLTLDLSRLGEGGPDYALRSIVSVVIRVAIAALGAFVISRRSENAVGWLIWAYGGLGLLEHFTHEYAIHTLGGDPGSLPAGEVAAWLQSWLWIAEFAATAFIFFVFPDGKFFGQRWRHVANATLLGSALLLVGFSLSPGQLQNGPYSIAPIANPYGVEAAADLLWFAELAGFGMVTAGIVAAVVSLLLRFRSARGEQRQQLKWFAFAAALMGLFMVENFTLHALGSSLVGTPVHVVPNLLAYAAIPIAAGIAILRYRLYAIDVIINRTLVYGTLTTVVVGLYILVVGALSTQLQVSGNLLVSLIATGLVAVLFQPLRERLQRSVNRLLYGDRDEPYMVLTRLGRRLEETLATAAVLPMIVESVARALKLPYTAIALERAAGEELAAVYGDSPAQILRLPLIYQAETIGHLLLSHRAPDEPFTSADRRLLDDLARQVGVAVHATRLTADLQRSRERLVTAREEERRRLRRDLHDGLGPTLAAQTLKVGAARALYQCDAIAADALLAELEIDMQTALTDIRRLVYNLRPPALDELGLIGAIREDATRYGTQAADSHVLAIGIEAPDSLPPMAAAVEVAAYRIVQEALTNVVRHAHAHTGWIRVNMDDALRLEITDDGLGLPALRHIGVGLLSMRERAEELGGTCIVERHPAGGTRVLARLPLVPVVNVPLIATDGE